MTRRGFLAGASLSVIVGQMETLFANSSNGTRRMPALFISHGSPMNAVADNGFTRDLKAVGAVLPRPKAVMVVSAHWYSPGLRVATTAAPETIYDFFGFPDPLYAMTYAAPGAPETAKRVAELTGADTDGRRGLDHGAWTVLHHLFPGRDIPVFQLSVDRERSFEEQYRLGAQLSAFRDQGVMLIGSGNVTHNLGERMGKEDAPAVAWAQGFSERFYQGALERPEWLIDPLTHLPHFRHAHPTLEHYLPALPVLGSKEAGETVRFFHRGFQYGTLDMGCFILA